MLPLHARTKEEYIRLIEGHLQRQELEPLTEMLHQAFDDYRHEEDFTAWCASVAFGTELPEAATLQARFLEKFPLSLHPIQVDYAECIVWEGQIDDGANEARAYLHRLASVGIEEYFERYELVRDAVSRAFMILTSVYTEAGARSYSLRVLQYAMLLQLDSYWQQRFRTEYGNVENELKDTNLAKLDQSWESFFQRGENLPALVTLAGQCRLPLLAKRLEVMAGLFKEDPDYKPGDEEIFQMVYETDKGAFVLV